MTWIIWCLGYAALASGLWAAGAFLFRLGHAGRLLTTVILPALVVGVATGCGYFDSRAEWPPEWALIFLVLCIGTGASAAIVGLLAWFMLEEWFGWRAR
ncbi:hypothetical protein OMP43_05005 [Sphingomonas sp. CBMAI 2297]|uniref:hypothetical protein n=1 Tax=Sphingomonas sp. CBMAI 2297 TaxID=2991720 RepID=UPI0024540881|nr:hypothetical protein [Sphingomonas sp. CBMAI 2297]MDH4743370.1 hypothetical protein [Sphingomonas sp. CBMAI 2297]